MAGTVVNGQFSYTATTVRPESIEQTLHNAVPQCRLLSVLVDLL